MKSFQPDIDQKGVLGRLDGAQIPHQLGGSLGNISQLSEFLCVDDAVIGLIRLRQSLKLVMMGFPVKIAAVHNTAAYRSRVAVHVLGGAVGHNIRSPLKGTAVDGGGKGIIHNQRHSMAVGHSRELLNIQHRQSRIGDSLREKGLGIGSEGLFQLLLRGVRVHQGTLYPHLGDSHRKQIGGSAVNSPGAYDVISRLAEVHHRIKVSRLPGRGQHRRYAALKLADLSCHCVVGGVSQPGIKIAALF